ncbi:hypothetical protein BDE36_1708 [Arcticibacter tournemirensis]|nr:hypothetical protein BDE36_1708 [Arcticibacter tournemirensis]
MWEVKIIAICKLGAYEKSRIYTYKKDEFN